MRLGECSPENTLSLQNCSHKRRVIKTIDCVQVYENQGMKTSAAINRPLCCFVQILRILAGCFVAAELPEEIRGKVAWRPIPGGASIREFFAKHGAPGVRMLMSIPDPKPVGGEIVAARKAVAADIRIVDSGRVAAEAQGWQCDATLIGRKPGKLKVVLAFKVDDRSFVDVANLLKASHRRRVASSLVAQSGLSTRQARLVERDLQRVLDAFLVGETGRVSA